MIEITADTRRAVVTNKELLTVGSAGIQVQFTLSEDWNTLSKLAVFRVGDDGTKVDVVLGESLTCVVPPEVLTEEDEVLFIGIYGTNGQGTVIIPTVWASAGVVKPGTIPNTPASAEPTPEIWAQILSVAQDAEQTATDAMSIVEDAVTHTPIIQNGYWYFWNEEAQEYQSTGIKAEGEDGTSPTITVTDITGGHRITITDVNGTQTVDVMNGQDGEDGDDGYSPAVTITEITGGHSVTITDKNGAHSFDVMDGEDGASDAGEVTYDDTATYPSGTVGAALTNQKNAISQKAPLIINTASGDIASFADGADGMQIRKIVGTIVTAEGGSGFTGATIQQRGANLVVPDNPENPMQNYTHTSTGTVKYSSEYDGYYCDGPGIAEDKRGGTNSCLFVAHTDMTVTFSVDTYNIDATYGLRFVVNGVRITDIHGTANTWYHYEYTANLQKGQILNVIYYGGIYWKNLQVVAGTSADQYYPYVANTLTINWQSEAGAILNGTVTLNADGSADVVNSDTTDTYHLTNVGSLSTLYGYNNIWIDTGAITECDYPADTKLYIDGLTEPDEDMIANANIASGKYFVVNNQLYLSTAAIAAGASIVPETNCTATNLAEALNAINT